MTTTETTTRDINTVLTHYIIAALWSSVDDSSEPFDNWATIDDLAPEAIAEMHKDVTAMIAEASTVAGSEWWSDEQFGHDLWLTRNHHGTGFWDRGRNAAGDALTAMVQPHGESDLYVGDDGKIYTS